MSSTREDSDEDKGKSTAMGERCLWRIKARKSTQNVTVKLLVFSSKTLAFAKEQRRKARKSTQTQTSRKNPMHAPVTTQPKQRTAQRNNNGSRRPRRRKEHLAGGRRSVCRPKVALQNRYDVSTSSKTFHSHQREAAS